MEVNGKLRALTVLPPEKQPPVLIGEELGLVHVVIKKKFPCPCLESNPAVQLIASCYTDYFVTRGLIRIVSFYQMFLKCC
jgi:hypothetical protein